MVLLLISPYFSVYWQTALGNNKWLQYKLIESLVEYDDVDEAARWTMFYSLSLESVHPVVRQVIDSW